VARYAFAAGLLACALVVATRPTHAQDPGQFFQSFNGVNPRNLNFQVPASTSRAMRSMNMRAMQPPAGAGTVTPNLNNSFRPNLALGTWPPKVANVFILKDSPYQPPLPNPKNNFSFINPLDFFKKDAK
jgi:hypothetical protein